MSLPLKVFLSTLLFGLFVILAFFGFRFLTSSNLETRLREGQPLAVRIALTEEGREDSLHMLFQLVLFPEKKRALLYFVNTDARYPDRLEIIGRMKPSAADRFENFTGVKSDYTISISTVNAARLIDFLEGFPVFVEKPIFFQKNEYQYPQGLRRFHGRMLLEYMMGALHTASDDDLLSSIDRVYRQESVLLNMLWRLGETVERYSDKPQAGFLYSLLDTGMAPEELETLLAFLADDTYYSVLEIPLETEKKNRRSPGKFVVKEQAARSLFVNFRDDLNSGKLRKKNFTMEVQNGTEKSRLARRVKQYIQDLGPVVLEVSNYDYKPLAETTIIDRYGNTFFAEALALNTGTGRRRVFFRRRAMQVNLTFVIGEDFKIKKLRL